MNCGGTGSIEQQRGTALIEILAAMMLTLLASLGIAMSLRTSLHVEKITEIHLAAGTLAAGKLEQMAALDPATLDASDNTTEAAVTYPSLSVTFTRTTAVVVNADDSRTVTVTVTSNHDALPTQVVFSTSFALWE